MGEEQYNIELVQLIEKHPCLYNYALAEYSRRDVTEKAWAEIAEESKCTVASAKEKWKNLRSVYVRKRKIPLSGSGRKAAKPYYLNSYMDFVNPFIKTQTVDQRNIPSPPPALFTENEQITENQQVVERAVTEDESEPFVESATVTTNSVPKKKETKLNEVEKSFIDCFQSKKQKLSDKSEHPRKKFLDSLFPELEDMSEHTFRLFKRRVLELIDNLSYQHMPSSQPYYSGANCLDSTSNLQTYYSNPSSNTSQSIPTPELSPYGQSPQPPINNDF